MREVLSMDTVSFAYETDEDVFVQAVADVSFTIREGEWVSIVGHNGSGKSTLAKLMIGLLFPAGGTVHVFLEPLTEDNLWDIRSKLGVVFQNPDNQFVGATVQDDVAFALENNGVPYETMQVRVKEALAQVGMSAYALHEPHHLSGGQKQRVAIAGALAMDPDILILDEATSMLDPQGRGEVIDLITELRRTTGLTVISITHDLEEVLLADRVLVMNQGRLVDSGTPESIFEQGSRLQEHGLDLPFALRMSELLREAGLPLTGDHMSEEELVNELWTLYFSK
ncbi:energy-coupling factor transporter ATP-binding protein EcfA1 [Sporosarcina sp. NCCP-2716]|uniref:energy-coupling factor ABC transporter ATP-binding protein n=1 Tax=Sporosarcina sp. NCCP-2716 TaxID=2943679 RepID=UPI00203F0BCF|nr:energy-coupling factor ABC transporter ATP-binding protein [Sporosarcina sp. NCCP-2716]GKV68413.1 energy-coupling factor transporter ATP-binding protein EcfA1 [Sporosarcina sp. NCCP-2716]